MNTTETPSVVCSNGKTNDVIILEFRNNLIVDLEVAKEIVENRLSFTQNKKHFVIIDFSNVKEVSLEAKEFMKSPDGGLKNILGAAFIASNPVSKMIANIFLKTPKDFQTQFFLSKEEASDWIDSYRSLLNNK